MTPVDLMLWSVAVMVFAVCVFVVFCIVVAAFQGTRKRRERDSARDSERAENKRGFRQMGN